MAISTTVKDVNPPKESVKTVPLPAPNGDFYEVTESLNAEELKLLKDVRTFMETSVAPIITKYWADDAFPFEVLPALRDLKISGIGLVGYRCRSGRTVLHRSVQTDLARVH